MSSGATETVALAIQTKHTGTPVCSATRVSVCDFDRITSNGQCTFESFLTSTGRESLAPQGRGSRPSLLRLAVYNTFYTSSRRFW